MYYLICSLSMFASMYDRVRRHRMAAAESALVPTAFERAERDYSPASFWQKGPKISASLIAEISAQVKSFCISDKDTQS